MIRGGPHTGGEGINIVIPEDVIKDAHRWKCGYCHKKFESKCDGLAHVKKHPESLKTSKEALTTIKHNYPKSARLFCPVKGCVRTVTGVASAKSNKNGRPFSSLFEVRRHWLRTHSTVKPYVCTVCAKAGKDFRFALKSDLKEHNLTCGLNGMVWICATPACNTQCKSKKALVRHCKRFTHKLPNPLVGVKSKSGAGIDANAARKGLTLGSRAKSRERPEQAPRKRLAVSGKALRAFEQLNTEEEQSRRERVRKEKTASSSQSKIEKAVKARDAPASVASGKKRSMKENDLKPEKIGRVVSGSRLLALEAALASY